MATQPAFDSGHVVAALAAGDAGADVTLELALGALPVDHAFAVVAGVGTGVALALDCSVSADVIARWSSLPALAGQREALAAAFSELRFRGDIWGVPDGTLLFAGEPLARITGKLAEVLLVERVVAAAIAWETRIATHAARLVLAAGGRPVIDGGLGTAADARAARLAARAAFLGGCLATTNLDAATLDGLPAAWVAACEGIVIHPSEERALASACRVLGAELIVPVDAYVAARGAARAVGAGASTGVLVERGDLAATAAAVRAALAAAGRPRMPVYAGGELDVPRVRALAGELSGFVVRGDSAPRLPIVRSIVSAAVGAGRTEPCIVLDGDRTSRPGAKQVWRLHDPEGTIERDRVGLASETPTPMGSPLAVPLVRAGVLLHRNPPWPDLQRFVAAAIAELPERARDLVRPVAPPVETTTDLAALAARVAAQRLSEE